MMSQSMTRKLQLEGFGFCIAYGKDKDMGIGLQVKHGLAE